jgi:hypothetical protein
MPKAKTEESDEASGAPWREFYGFFQAAKSAASAGGGSFIT